MSRGGVVNVSDRAAMLCPRQESLPLPAPFLTQSQPPPPNRFLSSHSAQSP